MGVTPAPPQHVCNTRAMFRGEAIAFIWKAVYTCCAYYNLKIITMAYFNKDKKSGWRRDGKKFGGRDFGGRRDGGRPRMFSAICSECGKTCEVPFRPTGEKPVYCNDCFKRRSGDSRGFRDEGKRNLENRGPVERVDHRIPSQRHDDTKNDAIHQARFDQLNNKLDQILELLYKERSDVAVIEKTAVKEKAEKPVVKKGLTKKSVTKREATKKKK